jgi:hypothetical protein
MKKLFSIVIFLSLTTIVCAQSLIYPSPFQQQQELYQQQRRDEMNLRLMRPETAQQQKDVNKQREMMIEQYKLDEKKKMNQQRGLMNR